MPLSLHCQASHICLHLPVEGRRNIIPLFINYAYLYNSGYQVYEPYTKRGMMLAVFLEIRMHANLIKMRYCSLDIR